MPGPSFPTTPVDLKLQLDAERNGLPCAVFHNDTRRQHIVTVDSVRDYLTIAPAASDARCHSRGDEKVSRPHVRLKPSGDAGSSTMPASPATARTSMASASAVTASPKIATSVASERRTRDSAPPRRGSRAQSYEVPSISHAQRKVLLALCRPYKHHSHSPNRRRMRRLLRARPQRRCGEDVPPRDVREVEPHRSAAERERGAARPRNVRLRPRARHRPRGRPQPIADEAQAVCHPRRLGGFAVLTP